MNRRFLIFAMIPFALSLMVIQAMAKPIGPHGAAGKNPHIMITPEGVECMLPSGAMHSWTADTEFWYFDFMHALDASKAKIKNALPLAIEDIIGMMTDSEAALEAENMWGYISCEVLVQLLVLEGLPEDEAEAMASMWPEGMYMRFVNVG